MDRQQIKLARATPPDLGNVQEVLTEAAQWMRAERGVNDQWPERFPDWVIEEAIAAGEMFLVRAGEDLVGTVRIQHSDESAWGADDAEAVYVHSLAVRRKFGGRGLGAAILDQVQREAAAAGRPLLRLDCVATNEGLKQYYRDLGFTYRGDVAQHIGKAAWTSSLFERSSDRIVE